MSIIEAIILGIVQGLTEFLPVSSSGHIELGKALLNVHPADPLLFSVVVHAATALSTLVVFRKDVISITTGLVESRKSESFRFSVYIVLSMIPAAFIGLFYNDLIEQLFEENVLLVGSMLILTGILLLITDFRPAKDKPLSFVNTLLIGIAQAIAILPGISRSGATISTAVLLGVNRTDAARFSFLMVVPLILGKMAKDLMDAKLNVSSDLLIPLVLGFFASFIVGLFACNWMIRLVKNSKLRYFAYYCFAVGVI
ncbi:MAG TPA: UDP-diphosphatase, partial [Flavobacteriales bacterium]|nr:UDP-diphosphatase [Flavobacteriales bacterium]